ncbi:translocation/assembly module TamB domain-containing protein [Paracoccus sp. MC1862]|uniref:translocation/assembly module TamB domain-containing protein n=1 Tax=Paracoccus sp. MC1862 TaxID=2760307 RepID=UPI00160180A9|nr:translocation/assembly module TamB domain-containing protein [Paracoccus sp. MC1862]MBB1498532.1 translocation/assembly module TamB domain-containing protein [Paracoccus sp. MC1862]QQO43879.1 translocation/assembly module TamB domain-containing protein [Paracoccus sp. MC1862]
MKKLLAAVAFALLLPLSPVAAQDPPAPAPAETGDIATDAAAISAEVEDDRGFITRFLERNLSDAGRQVEIRGFQGALSSRATFEELTIADDEGVWITIRNGAIQWNRSALFARRIDIQELSAGEIIIPRLPGGGESGPTAEAREFALPTLPVGINIARLSAARVALGEPIIGEAAVVSVDGSMNLAGGEGAAQLTINRVDGKRGVFAVDASYSNETTVLRLDLRLDEDAGGLFANLVELHDRPAVQAEIRGEGPLRDFSAGLRLATDGQDRVTGRASAHAEPGQDGTPGTAFRLELSGDVASLLPPENRAFFGAQSQLLAEGWRGENGRLSIPALLIDTESLNLTGSVTTNDQGAPQSVVLLMTLGEDAGATTLPARLPLRGEPIDVQSGNLQISYDAAQSDAWTLNGRIRDVTRGANRIGALTLNGGGSVVMENGGLEAVLGRIGFGAEGLALSDAGVQAALGSSISGETGFDFTPGNALELAGFSLSGRDYGLGGEILIDGLQSGITVSGTLDAAYEDASHLSALAGRPLSGQVSAEVSGLYTLLTRGFDAEITLNGMDVTVDQEQLDRLLAGDISITASARRDETGIEIRDFSVDSQRLTGQAMGLISSTATDLRATLRLASLTDADPAMAGGLEAEATVTGAPGARRVSVSGMATDLVLGISELDAALQGQTELTAVAQERDGSFVIDSFRLANPQIVVEGAGSFGEVLDAALEVEVPSLTALRPEMSGAVQATGRVSTRDGARAIEITGTGEDLRLGQQDVDGALTGTTEFRLSAEQREGAITINDLRLENRQMQAQVAGTLGQNVTDLSGSAEIRSLAAFGRGWQGALRVNGSLQDDGSGVRRLAVDGTGQDLSLGQRNVDGVLAGETRLTVRGTQAGQVFTIEQALVDNPSARADISGTIGNGSTDVSGEVDLRDLSALGMGWRGSFEAQGRFAEDGTGVRRLVVDGVANNLSLGQAQADAALAGETRLILRGAERDGVLTIEQAVVDNARLNATAQGTLGGGQTDVTAQLRADSLGFLGGGMGGALNATARLTDAQGGRRVTAEGSATGLRVGNEQADRLLAGTTQFDVAALLPARGPVGIERLNARNGQVSISAEGSPAALDVDAALSNLALLVPGLTGPATVSGSVGQTGTGYVLDLAATAPGGTRATIAGSAAADFSTADIRVAGISDAALANPMLRTRSIAGQVDFDLRLQGAPALENVTGRISLPGARLSDPNIGLSVENLTATADLNGGLITIDATGAIAEGGTLTVTGPVDLRGGTTLDLQATLNQVVLRDPNLYETVASGTVSISGNAADGPLVAGTITLGTVEFRIPNTGLGGRAIPDIIHLNDRPPVRATRAKAGLLPFPSADSRIAGMVAPPATPPANPARLDVTINAPNQVFVRGRGVDAELGGQIRLTGTARNVIPIGQLELIRGRVDLLGRRFDMTEGLIEMQGSLVPVLRLVAETQQDGITTRIIIDGDLRDPEITFQSDPELPEEEVLSQLLFGRGIETISPLQAAQLANAVAVLAGRGGEGLVGNLRNAAGLDDLDLATDDEGNISVRAGRYLSRNLYSDVSVDADGRSRINLNLDVNEAITARGSVASDGESTLGVFFERDY